MMDVLYLAWRYLAYHRVKTAILVASITLIVYLPVGLQVLLSRSVAQLTARAESTPLLIGAKGSPLELVLCSLYFESDVPPPMRFAEVQRATRSGLARAVALHARFQTRHGPIVGTSLEYFDFRCLEVERGRQFGMLGECVVGAMAARRGGIKVGDWIMSSPQSVFDIAGAYPLKMNVVGLLRPTGTPDDRAVFVDVKTAWVIEGLAHGHQDLSRTEAESGVLRREDNEIIANASVLQYNEITPENVGSFHFHGEPDDFPITAVIVVPADDKSSALFEGRYVGDEQAVHVVKPVTVMRDLIGTIFTVRRYLLIAVALVAVAALASMTLVFMLSLQLRRREMETLARIGGSRRRIASLIAAEVLSVILAGTVLAGLFTLATIWFSDSATRLLVQMV